MKHQKKHCI